MKRTYATLAAAALLGISGALVPAQRYTRTALARGRRTTT